MKSYVVRSITVVYCSYYGGYSCGGSGGGDPVSSWRNSSIKDKSSIMKRKAYIDNVYYCTTAEGGQ